MKRKHKPSIIGLNWENIFIYIIFPIFVIAFLAVASLYCKKIIVDDYIEQRKITESIMESVKYEQESKKESESYERYLKESSIIERQEKEEKESIEAAEQQHLNTLYQNKIFSNYWKKGTYVYDKKNNVYGVIDHCEIPHVITKEGWYFVADESNDYKNPDIVQVGWLDWHNWTMKQLNKKGMEMSKKVEELMNEEFIKRQQEAQKLYPKMPKYGYCKYDNEYYYILSWKNGVLKLRHRWEPVRNSQYIYVEFDDPKVTKVDDMMKFYVKEN